MRVLVDPTYYYFWRPVTTTVRSQQKKQSDVNYVGFRTSPTATDALQHRDKLPT